MDLYYINKFYQYLVADLLDSIMNLFCQMQSLELLIFCIDDQEFVANLDYVLLCFFCNAKKVNHF